MYINIYKASTNLFFLFLLSVTANHKKVFIFHISCSLSIQGLRVPFLLDPRRLGAAASKGRPLGLGSWTLLTFRLAPEARLTPWHAVPSPLWQVRSSSCQDGDPGLKREEGERGDSASTTGSRMSAAPRRPRAGESNNDLVIAESSKEQQQVVNGGGGDLRERSGSRRGRRRVTSLRGGEKGQGRSRQNQGQVGWMFY